MTKQRFIRLMEYLPVAVIGLAIILFIVCCVGDFGALGDQIDRLESGWRLNGEAVEALPLMDAQPKGSASVLEITLDERFDENQALCFYSAYQSVDVYLDGENIYGLHKSVSERITKAATPIWNTVYLPQNCEGSILKIEFSSPYEKYSNRIPEFYSGSPNRIVRFVSFKTVPPFVASLCVLCVGLILLLIAVNVRRHIRGQTGLYSLSLFVIVLALFLLSQQTTILISIYAGTPYVLIQHVCLMLCPLLYAWYIMRTDQGVAKKIAGVFLIVSAANVFVMTLLQFLRVCDMPEIFNFTRFLCISLIVFVFVMEFKRQRRIIKLIFVAILAYVLIRYYVIGTITFEAYLALFGYLYVIIYRVAATMIRAKGRQVRLEGELEASRNEIAVMQITSHFFYHTLDSIRALIRLDSDKAYKMTGDFAKYIRHRVDGMDSRQAMVSFAKELRAIRAYTDIKQAQLGDRFKMVFDVETDDFEILALSVQPLVENAVIHAMQLRREGGMIFLSCRETQQGYHIEVVDNGCGAESENRQDHEQKRSIAIENVNKRLEYYGIPPLQFSDNSLGGMTVSMDMPKKIKRKGISE